MGSYENGKRTRLARIWNNIKKRCYNPRHESYKYYGGAGIGMCDAWRTDFNAFEQWAVSHGYDDSLSIDRIDNTRGYSPDNCRWVDNKQQAMNRGTTKDIEYNGETHCLTDWATILGINLKTLSRRLLNGWTVDRAFSTPVLTQYARR